jgi:Tol biopolymer transport system component
MNSRAQSLIWWKIVATVFFLQTLLLSIPDLQAQYFGQNKVRYRSFNFKILKTEHFDVYFYPSEEKMATAGAEMAERWYARYEKILNEQLKGRQPLILYGSHPEFVETNTTSEFLSPGVGGFTEPLKRRIVLPLGSSVAESDHVIGHELVHAFQYNLTGQGEGGFMNFENLRLPLWFVEGMAEYLSIGSEDPNTAMWMRDAVRSIKKLPNLGGLQNPKYFPYRWGQALLAYIGGRWGDQTIGEMLRAAGRKGSIENAIRNTLNIGPDSLIADWHQSLHSTYDPVMVLTDTAYANANLLVSKKKGGGELNVSPVLSPDGQKMIFFSEKSLFAIDLYLANANTGKIEKKLTSIELDPHFQGIEFINSAGAWDPKGEKVVFGSLVKGLPELTIVNIKKDEIEKEIRFRKLGEILHPSWSPDGNSIIFSAQSGGESDLYLYDLAKSEFQQLTNDMYCELQPHWSPDGKQVVFVTDRFTTSLKTYNSGNYELAILDLGTKQITRLPIFKSGKHLNPQWSRDGQNLYFISDLNGITNLYRYNIPSGQAFQITNYYTGISGITSLSPAISVAGEPEKAIFSTYQNSDYDIYSITDKDALIGQPVQPDSLVSLTYLDPGQLPPDNRTNDLVDSLLGHVHLGLEPDSTFKIKPYRPKFSLDYVGQPFLFAGANRYGAGIGGGVSLYFSDMLGNHSLGTMFQLQADQISTDIAAAVGYINQKSRWDWGGTIQQIPYIYDAYAAGLAYQDSNWVYVEQQERFREIDREAAFFTAYPFNQAARLEFTGGYRNVTFRDNLVTWIYDPVSGVQLQKKKQSLPAPGAINMGIGSVAFVYDYSTFGATGPLLGQRYRFEVGPNYGNIKYYTLLADYRRYFMPVRPFTLAFRLMHYGRYGQDSEDFRLLPLYIGYQYFIRGYSAGSFSVTEAGKPGQKGYRAYNSLFGSRLLVGNVELRFPPLGILKLGSGYYGYLPLELALFYDAGVAWFHGEKPDFLKGGHQLTDKSYGISARLNLFGFAIGQVSFVNPVDRPQKGWFWQFDLLSGF